MWYKYIHYLINNQIYWSTSKRTDCYCSRSRSTIVAPETPGNASSISYNINTTGRAHLSFISPFNVYPIPVSNQAQEAATCSFGFSICYSAKIVSKQHTTSSHSEGVWDKPFTWFQFSHEGTLSVLQINSSWHCSCCKLCVYWRGCLGIMPGILPVKILVIWECWKCILQLWWIPDGVTK